MVEWRVSFNKPGRSGNNQSEEMKMGKWLVLSGGLRFTSAILVVLGLLLGFVGPLWAADPAPMAEAGSERRTTLADLPLPLQYTISVQFGRDDPAYHFAANTAAPQAANPQQGLTASFNPAGLRVLLIPSTPKYSHTPPAAPVVAQRSTPDEGWLRAGLADCPGCCGTGCADAWSGRT
jgi:hypothetical protein